jgi:hypothetical protein
VANHGNRMMGAVELGFSIEGYPGTGRRVEDDSDLAHVTSPDLLQGAFMGDAVFRLGDVDFSTRFGWITLLYWCFGLANTVRKLEVDGDCILQFSESDDFISFRVYDKAIMAASSYRPRIAIVQHEVFANSVREFVVDRLGWVKENYPSAFTNPAMGEALYRVGISLPG